MSGTLTEFVQIVGLCDADTIDLTQGNFTEIAVPEILEIPEQKPDVEQVLKVLIEGKVTDVRLIPTPEGEASSGMTKTGQGLIVEGRLHQKVVYVAETEEGDQPVHSAEFDIPFSTFIAINTCLEAGEEDQICVDICVEDVYVEMLNLREILKSVTIVVNAIVPDTDPEVTISEPNDGATFPTDTTEVPIKIEAVDCECLDRVEIVAEDSTGAVVAEGTEMAMGAAELIFDFDVATPAPETYTVTVTAIDCAENEAEGTITFTVV